MAPTREVVELPNRGQSQSKFGNWRSIWRTILLGISQKHVSRCWHLRLQG